MQPASPRPSASPRFTDFLPGSPVSRRPLAIAVRLALGLAPLAGAGMAFAQEEAVTEVTSDTMVVSTSALKVETPVLETPRATSQVSREELDNRQVNKYDEVLRYRSGVVSQPFGQDNKAEWFYIRGFNGEDSLYQDGLRQFREGGYFWWSTETFGLESVELLKGPASILYGEAPPGGVINAISKRPTDEPQGLIELQYGSDDHEQVGVDVSGPVAGRDDVRYRMVGLFRENDGQIEDTDNQRVYLAPSLELDLSQDTSVTFLASYLKDHGTPTNGFKLPYGTVDNTPFGKLDPEDNLGEPDYERQEHEQWALGYELSHRLDDTWDIEQNFRYSHLDLLERDVYVSYLLDDRNAQRGLTYRDGDFDAVTVDTRAIGRWYSDRTENTLLVGVDYQDLDIDYDNYDDFAFGSPFDIFDPEYGNFTPSSRNGTDHEEGKEQLGFYAQNQLRLDDRWIFLAGLRHDSVDVTNRIDGEDNGGGSEDETTFSGGVMYLGDYGISPYLSYSESFSPQIGTDPDGRAYRPSEGEQWEVGVKYAPDWLDGYITAAVFDLEESDTLYTSGESANRQGGERESQGFEIEGVGYVTDDLKVTAAYTYTDVRVDISREERDLRAGLIPRNQASLWLDYAVPGALHGLNLGGGVRYVGETKDSPRYSDATVDSYTLWDAKVSYDITPQWTAQVNVNNLTDEEYVSGCEYWCYYGEERSVVGSIKYRF
ncbi:MULTISPECIES: TonB-dependent siderophore receptor [unclassified Halomonas]|uniref:TonB-dependent siderophore receptor n=1 Tax=unclassified Halomonas TaxID=2609666 RepID=UPI0031F576C7